MEEDIPTQLGKCKDCKYFTGLVCGKSHSKEKIMDSNTECFTGFYEPLDVQFLLKQCYDDINEVIEYYVDMDEDVRGIISLWIIGTYFHYQFDTYPYLFLNAMRGSGKTRVLKLISAFSMDAKLVNSLTEATFFRTTGTLCIDEFERLGGKDKDSLRELLNSAYKRGTGVLRMKKQKTSEGESQVVEEFEPFRPIAMANIWGMDEVLGDRCITTLIEKSFDKSKIKLIENFYSLEIVKNVKMLLLKLRECSLCSVVTKKNIQQNWNNFVKLNYTNNTNNTTYTNYTNYMKQQEEVNDIEAMLEGHDVFKKDNTEFFEKVNNTEVDGRHLELFFPLFLIANDVGEEVLEKTLDYAKKIARQKKIDDMSESKDAVVYSVVAGLEKNKWIKLKHIYDTMRYIMGEGENEWLNTKWMGRALKRLNLITDKRRRSEGVEVMVNVDKAKQKEVFFKPVDEESLKCNAEVGQG